MKVYRGEVTMQIIELKEDFDRLQLKHGAKGLKAIYGAGCINNPKILFVFMNPTARNITCLDNWVGLQAPWIGTKNIWKLFYLLDLLDKDIYTQIINRKPLDWDNDFATKVYSSIKQKEIYITNLGKCTQVDARPLSDNILRNYLPLLEKEIEAIKPQKIITFGNQVSSILLGQKISVSQCRRKPFKKIIGDKEYEIYPTYYPVGQGMRNINLVIEDLKYIKEERIEVR